MIQPAESNTHQGVPVVEITNGAAVDVAALPLLSPAHFTDGCVDACRNGGRLTALTVLPTSRTPTLLAVIAHDAQHTLQLLTAPVTAGGCYPSLTTALPEAQAFEREVWERAGITPSDHPNLKPLRRHDTPYPFFEIDGPDTHQVAVGPVHAGVIEPGHFRSTCAGERMLHLEIHLGYQHRGVEAHVLGARPNHRLLLAESIAGDSVLSHGLAHCRVIEALHGVEAPPRALAVRAVALELERLANHVGDLGGLSGDVGFLPTASLFGRLRGEFLNALMALSGNRFGRGLLRVGGVRFDLDDVSCARLNARLKNLARELEAGARLLFKTPGVIARFTGTGALTRQQALDLGLVGPTARATGLARDVRRDHPFGHYRTSKLPVATAKGGDVLGRAQVRWQEIRHSLRFLDVILAAIPGGPLAVELPPAPPGRLAVALVEGWRGEVAHVATTGDDGALAAYKVVDPSFHNWFGEAIALRGNAISDFPLCNKSFNLSYAGHDL